MRVLPLDFFLHESIDLFLAIFYLFAVFFAAAGFLGFFLSEGDSLSEAELLTSSLDTPDFSGVDKISRFVFEDSAVSRAAALFKEVELFFFL